MPAPTTAAELADLIQKSGVVEGRPQSVSLDAAGGAGREPATEFAVRLVRDGVLTHFQAEQLLLGKWKRFSIGKYKVLERIGAGGMGHVFLCEHKVMRRRVAVKVLPSAKAEDGASLERFYREARAVAALDHPNLVHAYDIDQDGTLHFLVMEYVDGLSLHEIVKRSGPLDPLRACHYVAQAADGLQYAFEVASLVHRDIKPANVLVDRTGLVKILDMGLARFFNDEQDLLTKKYDETVLGTADYLAPEQALDSHGVDIRADIYSLGCTFYYLLTGGPPFPDGTIAQKLIWHQTQSPRPVRELRPEVPERIAAVLERMMAKEPSERYQTPAEVAMALAAYTQIPIPPPSDNELPKLSPAATGSSGPMVGSSPTWRAPSSRPAPSSRVPGRGPSPAAPSHTGSCQRTPGAPAAVAATCGPRVLRDDSNPFAQLIATAEPGAPHAQLAHQVYATASRRAATTTLPAAEPPARRGFGWMVGIVVLSIGLAGGIVGAWRYLAPPSAPAGTSSVAGTGDAADQ